MAHTSKQFRLHARDYMKGALLSVITSVLTVVYDSVQLGDLNFDGKKIATVAIASAIGYLLKNVFEGPKVIIPAKTNKDAEEIKQNLT